MEQSTMGVFTYLIKCFSKNQKQNRCSTVLILPVFRFDNLGLQPWKRVSRRGV
jgi:hypothetical protein